MLSWSHTPGSSGSLHFTSWCFPIKLKQEDFENLIKSGRQNFQGNHGNGHLANVQLLDTFTQCSENQNSSKVWVLILNQRFGQLSVILN